MGTGGTTQLSSLDIHLNVMHIQNYTEEKQRSAALAALSRFAVLRSKTASLKCIELFRTVSSLLLSLEGT